MIADPNIQKEYQEKIHLALSLARDGHAFVDRTDGFDPIVGAKYSHKRGNTARENASKFS